MIASIKLAVVVGVLMYRSLVASLDGVDGDRDEHLKWPAIPRHNRRSDRRVISLLRGNETSRYHRQP